MKCICLECGVQGDFVESTDLICCGCFEKLQTQLATATKRTKNIKAGAENSIYNLLNAMTGNKYGPYSVSQKDVVMPRWFDALVKEVKILQAELATARKQLVEDEQTEAAVLPENVGIREYVGSLKARLATAKEENRWIPVAERLPKREGQVWICYKDNGYTYGGYYNPTYKLWQIFDPCGGWSNIDSKSPPTHWRPITLPEGE